MMGGFIAEGKETAAWSTMTGGLGLQLLLPQDAFLRALQIIPAQEIALGGRLIGLTQGFL